MKICVYAICKNELQFVDRFMESIGDYADVYIGDTGSTDGTIEAFRKYKNCTVFEYSISPWRFDKARQTCLEMIGPNYDLYFSLDVDEVIITKDWKRLIEKQCKDKGKITQVYYKFEPYFDENGKPTSTFMNNRIHSWDFEWKYAIHEVIVPKSGLKNTTEHIPELVVHHFPDKNKTTVHSYLPLLKMSYDEMPDDPRLAHYLGREYLFAGELDNAIATLEKHCSMPQSQWRSEISCSMRLIAEAYIRKDDLEAAEFWFMKACIETIEKEPYVQLAKFYYRFSRWRECLSAALQAYNIKEKKYDHYSNSHYANYGGGPEDLASIAYYNLGHIQSALHFAKLAYEADPTVERYRTNVDAIQRTLDEIKANREAQNVKTVKEAV